MTKEQEEAIKTIDKIIKSYIEADECGLSNNDFKHEIRAMQTVLSMLKEISADSAEKDKIIAEKSAEIEKLKRDFKIVDQECSRLERKEAKQDKMIDLLIDYIDKLTDDYTGLTGENNIFCDEKCIDKNIDCYDCIKQYFEQKATNDG